MSKHLYKRKSVQSPHPQRTIEGKGDGIDSPKKKLNRSMTIAGSGSEKELQLSREPSSPLKRFSRAKEAISHAFDLLQTNLIDSQEFMCRVHEGSKSKCISALIGQTELIAEILKRNHMKVAFFGRTSNGKSTVINSLLREGVLPAGIGHTTNCFCSVVGVDESEGYLVPPNSEDRQSVKNVKQLAHSLHKERLDTNSMVKISWPKTKCPLLSGEVELVDSPGIDMTPDIDEWIDKYCLDADVFVLVSNAESTLNISEKKFFHRVSERLSKPNIFIVNNRWDCSIQEEQSVMEEVKKQHFNAEMKFLTDELAVVDEETAKKRIFFVSAKEVLHIRTKLQPGTVEEEEGRGLADGWKVRLMEFEKFEEFFKQCISSSAILTKFEQHYKQGLEMVQEHEQLLEKELAELTQKSEDAEKKKNELMKQKKFMEIEGVKVKQRCQEHVDATCKDVETTLSSAIKDMEGQLPGLVQKFEGEVFSLDRIATYVQSLSHYMDDVLSSELNEITTNSLTVLYDETKGNLIDDYQSLLKLPDNDVKRFYRLINPPSLSFAFMCADLCEDFSPDLRFNFFRSLGLSNSRLKNSLNLELVLGGAYNRISSLWGLLPTEYAIPMVLVGGAFMFPKVISWRVWLVSLSVFGLLYGWKWSTFDPETAVKNQFAEHVTSKLKTQTLATCHSYKNQVKGGLNVLLQEMQSEVEEKGKCGNETINHLTKYSANLNMMQQESKGLKNSVHLLRNDFEKFKEDYLVKYK